MLMGTHDSLSSNKGRELIQRSAKNWNWKFRSYDTYTRRRGITCLRCIHLWHSGPPIKKPSLFPQPELCCLYDPILFQNLLFQSLHQLLAYSIIRHYCGRRWHREYNAQAQSTQSASPYSGRFPFTTRRPIQKRASGLAAYSSDVKLLRLVILRLCSKSTWSSSDGAYTTAKSTQAQLMEEADPPDMTNPTQSQIPHLECSFHKNRQNWVEKVSRHILPWIIGLVHSTEALIQFSLTSLKSFAP